MTSVMKRSASDSESVKTNYNKKQRSQSEVSKRTEFLYRFLFLFHGLVVVMKKYLVTVFCGKRWGEMF